MVCRNLLKTNSTKRGQKNETITPYRFQITFHVSKTPTTTPADPLCRLGYHNIIQTVSIKYATADNLEALDDCAFFEDGGGGGGHGAGKNTADVSMMTAGGGEENNLGFWRGRCREGEDGGYDGYVRKVAEGGLTMEEEVGGK